MRFRLAAVALLAAFLPSARADDDIDSVMYRDPELPGPRVVTTLPARLPGLWVDALARPEADLKCQAAQAIATAHARGFPGMAATTAALARELDRPAQHPTVRLAVARALVVLDAKESAAALARAAGDDPDLREFTDPALARWDYAPARAGWLDRLAAPPTRRGSLLAIRALGTVREAGALPRLRELTLDRGVPAAVRLEAARAVAVIRPTGAEADARDLAKDASPRGLTDRLVAVSLLRQHTGDESVRLLQTFARDPEPAVAAVALARLVEFDPGHVVPLLEPVLASPDANVRGFGVEVLFLRPSAAHVRLLGERLADPHPGVRGRARRVLRDLSAKAEWTEPMIQAGTAALGGRDWRGLEQAALLLAGRDHKPAAGRLVDLLRHDRPEVAVAAAWGLRTLAVPDTLPAALAHFDARYQAMFAVATDARPAAIAAADDQLSQQAQFLGQARHRPADAALRRLIPQALPATNPAGPEARAAAVWALGRIHEGEAPPELVRPLVGRLRAILGPDIEDDRVRRMVAVTLGRMKAAGALGPLREFYTDKKPSLNAVNNACGWAIERITGETVPPPGVVERSARDWFLAPLD